jgi:acetate kinase
MLVMTVNSGSTSIKLGAFEVSASDPGNGTQTVHELAREKQSGESLPEREILQRFLGRFGGGGPRAVAHRVVHGGTRFREATLLDAEKEAALAELSALAPLHNPPALRWIRAAREACGKGVAQIAVFDTAFFARLPRVAAEYAIPARIGTALGVRRYGFHGLAHEAMWRRWRELRPDLERGGRLITLQLGGGCSIAAIDRGAPIDTSMGFSPLEGLVMASRSGDIDPSVVPYLERKLGLSGDQVVERLNRESGLFGLSGGTSDMSALVAQDSAEARFAVELYCYRARKYVGAYLAALGGCDGIVFGGGVGEHVPQIRERILRSMAWAGIALDAQANEAARGAEAHVSAAASEIEVRVVPVDEEVALARAAVVM